MRDDPLPLASTAVDLLQRAARKGLAKDPELEHILRELAEVLPLLRADEAAVVRWMHLGVPPDDKEDEDAAA